MPLPLLAQEQQATLPPDLNEGRPTSLLSFVNDAARLEATLNQMLRWTVDYRTDPQIRAVSDSIVQAVPGKAYLQQCAAVQDWVRNNIRYNMDVYDTETLQTPVYTLQRMQGDCDDHALLVGTLLQAAGHPVRYTAIASQAPGLYDHVFAETLVGRRWMSVETTENVPLGWWPDFVFSRKTRTV